MDKYYTEEEMTKALQRASKTINLLTEACEEYTRGINDCFAFFAEYDKELRGEKSKARDVIKYRWKSTREFVVKLAREGYSIEDYAVNCGYEIVGNKRPILGDVAFDDGAMICDGSFWVSTDENNKGVKFKRQTMFLERNTPIIARPIRS